MVKNVMIVAASLIFTSSVFAIDITRTKAHEQCCDKAQNNLDMSDCHSNEFKIQDKRLNVQYKKAMKIFSHNPKLVAAFKESQRAWLKYVDSKCGFYNFYYEGGRIAPLVVAECQVRETMVRADEVEEFASR